MRMRDHYRPQKMALWLNLVPDLQSAAAAAQNRHIVTSGSDGKITGGSSKNGGTETEYDDMLDYRLYSELLPFVPKLKNVDVGNEETTPASSEV